MKKRTTFIIAAVITVCSLATMIGSQSAAATKQPAVNATVIAADTDLSSNGNSSNGKTTTTSSKTDDPEYIIIAMYNGECYTLDCYNSDKWSKAISNPTILPYPGEPCRDVDLMFVGPKEIKKINVVDKKSSYMASSKFTTHDKGVSHSHFVMDPELAAVVHDLEDGDHTYEFYLEIISTDGTVSYTSVWYK